MNSDIDELTLSNGDTIFKDGNGNVAVIPKGFMVSGYEDERIIKDGLVIYQIDSSQNIEWTEENKQGLQETYNQFVWIPVDNYSEFIIRSGYSKDSKQSLTDYGEADNNGTNSMITESVKTQEEAQQMYTSVEIYGGFYIGRYEVGRDNSGNVVIKKGASVYNNIPWSANGQMQETDNVEGGAVELSRNFDTLNNYTSVTSTLIYSVQWDAVMKWMENIENPNATGTLTKYIQNSTGMGWYSNNYGNTIHQTGTDVDSNKSNCVNNIYDLAGNVFEWTMESYNTDRRVIRGGYYDGTGYEYPASRRSNNVPSSTYSRFGFRIALYLKS